jgi:hypothetical protein
MNYKIMRCILLANVFILDTTAYAEQDGERACPKTISSKLLSRMIEGGNVSSSDNISVPVAGMTYELKVSKGRLKMLRVKLSKAFKLKIDKMSYADVELNDHNLVRKHGNEKFELARNVDITLSKLLGKTSNSLLCGYIIKRGGQFLYQNTTEEVAVKITFDH